MASRAADGGPTKLAFVDVRDRDVDGFRDRLFAGESSGGLGPGLVVGLVTIVLGAIWASAVLARRRRPSR